MQACHCLSSGSIIIIILRWTNGSLCQSLINSMRTGGDKNINCYLNLHLTKSWNNLLYEVRRWRRRRTSSTPLAVTRMALSTSRRKRTTRKWESRLTTEKRRKMLNVHNLRTERINRSLEYFKIEIFLSPGHDRVVTIKSRNFFYCESLV